ncbi:MAG: dienelactone hydrolase family protein [Bryobacteraceae bacterium]
MSDSQPNTKLDRRGFVAATAAMAVTAASAEAQAQVVEKNVEIKTPDGTCDAAFFHPATGAHAGVLVWADAFGLRPGLRELGKRLAAEGYSVLVPNPFYRMAKAPVVEMPPDFARDRAKITPLMASVTAAGAAERDAAAYIGWLDAQAQVDKSKKIGTQGYCMGGPLIMRTGASLPNRVGAAASFHGGGLTTAAADSPHTLIPKMKARLYVGIASNDDATQPESKTILRKSFDDAKVNAEIEVYNAAQHGWCMADTTAYHRESAEKAWTKLLALYKTALA